MSAARYLIFHLHRENYAVALENVAEIMDPPTFYPLPNVTAYYRGVMNCHGRPMPVVDLSQFCKKRPSAGPGKIIVLGGKSANLALLVDDVASIINGDFPSAPPACCEPGVERVIDTADGAIRVIEPETLLAELEEEING